MSLDPIRRIISGKKARFVDKATGVDLDLVFLTERIILMGYPATGLSATYRNPRPAVLAYLTSLNRPYMVLNLCPRSENSYPSSLFAPNPVARFPWPDHLPPPLSILPLLADKAKRFLQSTEDNNGLIVIHCKAGKGRSGTAGISIMRALKKEFGSAVEEVEGKIVTSEEDATNVAEEFFENEGYETDASSFPPSSVELSRVSTLSKSNIDPFSHLDNTIPISTVPHSEILATLLAHHTSRRMSSKATRPGVSISSQQRFLGYFDRVMDRKDVRSPTGDKSLVKLLWVKLSPGAGISGMLGKAVGGDGEKIAVQVRKYKDSIVSTLRQKELQLQKGQDVEVNDDEWDDADEMVVPLGLFKPNHTPSETAPTLLSAVQSYHDLSSTNKIDAKQKVVIDGGILADGDREVQLRFLIGRSGRKHGKLGDMGALGVLWFIPNFESSTATSPSSLDTATSTKREVFVRRFLADEIDFLKPFANLKWLEVAWTPEMDS